MDFHIKVFALADKYHRVQQPRRDRYQRQLGKNLWHAPVLGLLFVLHGTQRFQASGNRYLLNQILLEWRFFQKTGGQVIHAVEPAENDAVGSIQRAQHQWPPLEFVGWSNQHHIGHHELIDAEKPDLDGFPFDGPTPLRCRRIKHCLDPLKTGRCKSLLFDLQQGHLHPGFQHGFLQLLELSRIRRCLQIEIEVVAKVLRVLYGCDQPLYSGHVQFMDDGACLIDSLDQHCICGPGTVGMGMRQLPERNVFSFGCRQHRCAGDLQHFGAKPVIN